MARDDKPRREDFTPVPVKPRHDGWTPDKQIAFIQALAECGCVDEACKRVGMGRTSAYSLRTRTDAIAFRLAWDAALEVAVQALSDAVFSRALHGVARPVFYKGEQVGERVYFDERLAMFVLRYRDPARYGAWLDRTIAQRGKDHAAQLLGQHLDRLAEDTWADELGQPRPAKPYPASGARIVSETEWVASTAPKKRKGRGT
ncbi:MAG: hypothetical protein M3Q19_12180 [Pseudomonadota bacterium]|nr:hypothetical protein [Pseudomonadota bacterium]